MAKVVIENLAKTHRVLVEASEADSHVGFKKVDTKEFEKDSWIGRSYQKTFIKLEDKIEQKTETKNTEQNLKTNSEPKN